MFQANRNFESFDWSDTPKNFQKSAQSKGDIFQVVAHSPAHLQSIERKNKSSEKFNHSSHSITISSGSVDNSDIACPGGRSPNEDEDEKFFVLSKSSSVCTVPMIPENEALSTGVEDYRSPISVHSVLRASSATKLFSGSPRYASGNHHVLSHSAASMRSVSFIRKSSTSSRASSVNNSITESGSNHNTVSNWDE